MIKSNPWDQSTGAHDQQFLVFPVTSHETKNSMISVSPQDPMAAAGVGLGVASLALQAFAGSVKGYQLFMGARGMPSQDHYLRIRLSIEQERLLNWGEKVGLEEERLEQPNRTLQQHGKRIIQIMIEVQKTFKESAKLDLPPPATETGAGDTLGAKTMLEKTLKFLEKVPPTAIRLNWGMVKKDKFRSLVEKLIDYNTYIEDLLDISAVEQLIFKQQQAYMRILQLHSDVAELKEISSAMYFKTNLSPLGSGSTISSPWYSDPFERDGNRAKFAHLAKFKAIITSLLAGSPDIEPINNKDIDFEELDNDSRSVGVYQSQHIWIEWKYFGSHMDWNVLIQNRVKQLATLLGSGCKPPHLGAPHCLGYFNDTTSQRYGLIYSKPTHVPPLTKPISLFNLLRSETQPSLSERITLAHAIARCLMYLHSVDWLHRDLRSNNIIFFAPDGKTPLYHEPIIAGFEFARPNLLEEEILRPPRPSQDDVYQHPAILRGSGGSRFLKSYDIYGLGVVLVEIAYWHPVKDILRLPEYPKELRNVRKTLLKPEMFQGIQNQVGELYASVVRRCLAGGVELGIPEGADESDLEMGVRMQSVFAEEIVNKLGNIRI